MADAPDRPPTTQFLAALSVACNAKIGLAVGVVFAACAYVYRVFALAGPTADSRGSPALFVLLAATLALALAAVVAVGLTLISAYRLAHEK